MQVQIELKIKGNWLHNLTNANIMARTYQDRKGVTFTCFKPAPINSKSVVIPSIFENTPLKDIHAVFKVSELRRIVASGWDVQSFFGVKGRLLDVKRNILLKSKRIPIVPLPVEEVQEWSIQNDIFVPHAVMLLYAYAKRRKSGKIILGLEVETARTVCNVEDGKMEIENIVNCQYEEQCEDSTYAIYSKLEKLTIWATDNGVTTRAASRFLDFAANRIPSCGKISGRQKERNSSE